MNSVADSNSLNKLNKNKFKYMHVYFFYFYIFYFLFFKKKFRAGLDPARPGH